MVANMIGGTAYPRSGIRDDRYESYMGGGAARKAPLLQVIQPHPERHFEF